MSAMYSTIAFAASVAAGTQGASYELRRESRALQIFGAFNALGTIMFAFGGHAILLEVQVSRPYASSCLKLVSFQQTLSACVSSLGRGQLGGVGICVLAHMLRLPIAAVPYAATSISSR